MLRRDNYFLFIYLHMINNIKDLNRISLKMKEITTINNLIMQNLL